MDGCYQVCPCTLTQKRAHRTQSQSQDESLLPTQEASSEGGGRRDAHCAREPCGDRYLDVVVNGSAGRLRGCTVAGCGLREAEAVVSGLGAGAAQPGREAGHPVQRDGSLCAAQGREAPGVGLSGAGWVTASGAGPPVPVRVLMVPVLVPG